MRFEHERIDDDPAAARMGFRLTADLTRNYPPDVVGAVGRKAPVDIPFLDGLAFRGKLTGTREVIDVPTKGSW